LVWLKVGIKGAHETTVEEKAAAEKVEEKAPANTAAVAAKTAPAAEKAPAETAAVAAKTAPAAEKAAVAAKEAADEKAPANAAAVAGREQKPRPRKKAATQKMGFYRDGSVYGAGLLNRGTKGNKGSKAGKIRMQSVQWTGNRQEWIASPDDVVICKSSSTVLYLHCTPGKYRCEDGSVYTAFPVFPAEEWEQVCRTLDLPGE
jgi:hypothetical protein